jgi:hypothetical protein
MGRLRRRALAIVATASLFAVAGACSSAYSGTDEPSPAESGTPDATDGKSVEASDDAAVDVAPSQDASADVENLLSNGGFELGCAGWVGINATLSQDSTARSGMHSCRVCASGTFTFNITQQVPRDVVAGETYAVEAYVHTADDAGTPAAAMAVLIADVAKVGGELQRQSSTASVPRAAWDQISGLLNVNAEAGAMLDVSFLNGDPGDGGGRNCFLIDDARLYHP